MVSVGGIFASQDVSANTLIYLVPMHTIYLVAGYGLCVGSCPKSSREGRRKVQESFGLDCMVIAYDAYFNTCPSGGASAFCLSLVGSESLEGVT